MLTAASGMKPCCRQQAYKSLRYMIIQSGPFMKLLETRSTTPSALSLFKYWIYFSIDVLITIVSYFSIDVLTTLVSYFSIDVLTTLVSYFSIDVLTTLVSYLV